MGWGRNRTGQDTDSREDQRVGRRVGPARRARPRLRLRRVLPGPFLCGVCDDVDDDVEANRRVGLAWRWHRARNVADCRNALSYCFIREQNALEEVGRVSEGVTGSRLSSMSVKVAKGAQWWIRFW